MDSKKLGLISLFTAASFYGLYGIFSRLIGTSFGNFNQNWVRNLVVFLLMIVVIVIRRAKVFMIGQRDFKWILLWFLCGSWSTVPVFIAFNYLPIGTVYLLLYSSMIFAGFISGKIFFQEKLDTVKSFSIFLCLAGLFIIYRFSISTDQILYLGLALLSGFMTGIWNTVSKKFSSNYSNNQLVLIDAGSSVIVSFVLALIFGERLLLGGSFISWFWVGVYGIVSAMNVGLIVYGFKNIEAQLGSIVLPVEIIFATIFSYLIFGEIPALGSIFGGALILAAAVIPSLYYMKREVFLTPGVK